MNKAVKRVVKRCTENKRVSIQRMYHTMALAAIRCFGPVSQTKIGKDLSASLSNVVFVAMSDARCIVDVAVAVD